MKITSKPDVMGGELCFDGTAVMVRVVGAMFMDGTSLDDLRTAFPEANLTTEDLLRAGLVTLNLSANLGLMQHVMQWHRPTGPTQ